jgi:hypothetical protein
MQDTTHKTVEIVESRLDKKKVKKFISVARLGKLEDYSGFLKNYQTVEGQEHFVGNSLTEVEAGVFDHERTQQLRELGEINKRQEQLIKLLIPPPA